MLNNYDPNKKPDANRYGQLRSYYAKLGVPSAVFGDLFGTPQNPKTNGDGLSATVKYTKTLPKGKK